jgi:hypothetical protein
MDETQRRIPMQRICLSVLLLLALLAAAVAPVAAQTSERCFAETGYCISGPIRAYWERNGGLPVFGYPITEQRMETAEGRLLTVQWFERDRLEIQDDGTLTAGRLGARVLELQWRPWFLFALAPATNLGPCQTFAVTGHSACGPFLEYWSANGGLERFGYPITPVIEEQIEGLIYRVQYFERRRMELHSELPSSPILLGRLGDEVRNNLDTTWRTEYPRCLSNLSDIMMRAHVQLPAPEVLGCPILYAPTGMPASIQRFERGEMIWFDPPDVHVPGGVLPRMIVAYIQEPGTPYPTFMGPFYDDWQAGQDPERPDVAPPPGYYAPWHGFGKVWVSEPELAAALGWALEPEAQPRLADYQIMDGLLVRLYTESDSGVVYAFGDPEVPSQVRRVTP